MYISSPFRAYKVQLQKFSVKIETVLPPYHRFHVPKRKNELLPQASCGKKFVFSFKALLILLPVSVQTEK
jgi:hypothetical protein